MSSGSFYSLSELGETRIVDFKKIFRKGLKILLTSFPLKLLPMFHD
jgi:hypothetical protein